MKRMIMHSQPLPRFYGPSYFKWNEDVMVCYPLGIHLIVKWVYRLYCWMRQYNANWLDKKRSAMVNHHLDVILRENARLREELWRKEAQLREALRCEVELKMAREDLMSCKKLMEERNHGS